jgi:hypothetical protein
MSIRSTDSLRFNRLFVSNRPQKRSRPGANEHVVSLVRGKCSTSMIKSPSAFLAEEHYVTNKIASAQRKYGWEENNDSDDPLKKYLREMPGTMPGKTGWYECGEDSRLVAHFTRADTGWKQTYKSMDKGKWWDAVLLKDVRTKNSLPRQLDRPATANRWNEYEEALALGAAGGTTGT